MLKTQHLRASLLAMATLASLEFSNRATPLVRKKAPKASKVPMMVTAPRREIIEHNAMVEQRQIERAQRRAQRRSNNG